ncbi:MAG: polysaccharide biosynthesis tyrosine autokinase [Bacteroidales bacterium]|nr:polysaccharide biosynthesis tyrosine autokinase [Bacteroidales bacterium]
MLKTNDSDASIAPIKYFIFKVASLKYLYIFVLILCLAIAFFFNKYSSKVFEASATLSPVENKTSSILSSNQLFGGLNPLQTIDNIENDISNLSSFGLVYSTVAKMNLEVSYFSEEHKFFKQTQEIYGYLPFTITIDKSHIQPVNTKIYITHLDDSTFRITISDKNVSLYNYVDNMILNDDYDLEVDTICKFGETIQNKAFKFSVTNNRNYVSNPTQNKHKYFIKFNHLDYLAKRYLKSMDIHRISPLASIINIKFTDNNLEKTIKFLNQYLNSFLDDNLGKKNKIALSTVNFIDSQISEISDSLNISESQLRNYRAANQVMDLSFQGQQTFEQMTLIQQERATLQLQQRYYNYVINYFKANQDMAGVVPPSAMNVSDPITNQMISELLNLYNQRSTITAGSSTDKNIFLGQIDNRIRMQRQAIIENFTNNLNTLTLSLNELDYRENKLSREISQLPRTEMNMVGMKRKFDLNDAIYTYLLQKRSEAAIALASNYPDYEILEPAREITSKIVSPKDFINYLIAVFMGLLIPTMYLVLRDFFDDKIRSLNDAEYLLHKPILSVIYSNNHKSESVVAEFPKSAVSESFRNLRSSLFLKAGHEQSKVILITSSQPQDGKSFISFNLASSIASVGYKTILIDCDLRRPTLHSKLKVENRMGLTNYMTKNASLNEIIRHTNIENLSFIPAGPVIPNPSEMMELGVLDGLIGELKSRFDYIIIDTTPVGIVADAILMMKYASKVLMVMRNNYTRKDILVNVINNLRINKLNNYDIVYNDLNLHKSSYRHYSNYYIKN